MEKTDEKPIERKNGFTKSLKETIIITILDLSSRNIANIPCSDLPPSLIDLNLSHNNLKSVPPSVLELKCLKILNLSYNYIDYFDETPAFCHTIEKLNLKHNKLLGPPYWVWSETPKNLIELDICRNIKITNSLDSDYLHELLHHKTLLRIVNMANCKFDKHFELIQTFANAKVLDLSSDKIIFSNTFTEVPCKGLDQCCDIERLNLSYTGLSNVKSNIDMFRNLIEINLSQNYISNIPDEFCKLINLEICILSYNSIVYLPEDVAKLKKLSVLCVDNNKLCMLPEKINDLQNLIKLDMYNNYIYDIPEGLGKLEELDLAQNYFDEPDDEVYMNKKNKLRLQLDERLDGRKFEICKSDSTHSERSIDEEIWFSDFENNQFNNDTDRQLCLPDSEDWDSDDYWVPHFPRLTTPPQSPWLYFIKRKMAEGNFCPIDAHAVPIAELVKYENMCHPKMPQEIDGQFDDLSDDAS